MRNKCKHINIETLMPHINSLGNAQIEWCRNCGSRRFVAIYENTIQGTIQSPGKWKSPKIFRR